MKHRLEVRRKFGQHTDLQWLIVELELESVMRDGDPCPTHGDTRQCWIWPSWRHTCCGHVAETPPPKLYETPIWA